MNISTKDAMGKMFFTMTSAFAELEVNSLNERTKKLSSNKSERPKSGWPSLPEYKKWVIKFLYDEQKLTYEEIGNQTGKVAQLFIELLKKWKTNIMNYCLNMLIL